MPKRYCLLLIFLFLAPACINAQTTLKGTVFDAKTREVIPFATVKFDDNGHGVIGTLNGQFEIPPEYAGIHWIEVSYLGYETQRIKLPAASLNVYLQHQTGTLKEVIVTPPYDKIRRILNNAIANKGNNNPDKYDWYRCHVYYKMLIDAVPNDSAKIDTDKETRAIVNFMDSAHLIMSETYSIRTWRRPQQLQEDVIGSRFSGFKKSMFTGLVTDVLPFHAYNNYIALNGKDYHNPVSNGFEQYYKFNLSDELMNGNDTVWVLTFLPKGNNANQLKGTVYINSHGYAISRILARTSDTMLKLSVRIEQEYQRVSYGDRGETRWFPSHLNYILDWQQKSKKSAIDFHMKGYSRIDSVLWNEEKNFKFDKTHTVRLKPNADILTDSTWKAIRPEAIDRKEAKTYQVIDSIGRIIHLDDYMNFLSKAPEGKITLGAFDFDIKRIMSYNYYENLRLGLGLQTNERVIKWLSVGGWVGYGFGDAHWKYGLFAEAYADPHREFVFKVGYEDDIHDPGRVRLHRDLDKNYLSTYLLQRVDNTRTYSASVRKKIDYWNVELSAMQQEIIPKYHYALNYEGGSFTRFTANEASLNFRYAYAERTAPYFNYYYSTGTRYPIWYGKVTTGNIGSYNYETGYTQALTAIVWHKHLNRIGYEHFFVEGGKSWSDHTLPLSKLFAGNGYKYNTNSWLPEALYTFGGMMTMYPYEYYTDQFVNFIFRHDFDWKLYKVESSKSSLGSAPYICLQYNVLYGTLDHPEKQQYVAFGVPDNAYHEAGILLNNLVRVRYLNLWYLTCNLGYFHHITDKQFDAKNDGRVVFGAGIEF